MTQPDLSVSLILAWADAFHARSGRWPTSKSGRVPAAPGAKWRNLDNALRYGLRGLPGGSSLAQLLAEYRGVRNRLALPPLTEEKILAWADAHHRRTGAWPTGKSGAVADAPGETWKGVELSLYQGRRALPGGATIARLLARRRGVHHRLDVPRLTVKRILAWADAHHRQTGQWPKVRSGPILHAPGETWMAVEGALAIGARGLPGGSSLAQVLAEHRGVRNRARLPRLTQPQILAWAWAYRRRTGQWPTGKSGPVTEAPGETWMAVAMALFQGLRGLPGGTTLARLLKGYGQDEP